MPHPASSIRCPNRPYLAPRPVRIPSRGSFSKATKGGAMRRTFDDDAARQKKPMPANAPEAFARALAIRTREIHTGGADAGQEYGLLCNAIRDAAREFASDIDQERAHRHGVWAVARALGLRDFVELRRARAAGKGKAPARPSAERSDRGKWRPQFQS